MASSRCLSTLALIGLTTGCHTVGTVRSAPMTAGASRSFAAGGGRVTDAVRAALEAAQLEVTDDARTGDRKPLLIAEGTGKGQPFGSVVRVIVEPASTDSGPSVVRIVARARGPWKLGGTPTIEAPIFDNIARALAPAEPGSLGMLPGSRIRLTTIEGRKLAGRLMSRSADSVRVAIQFSPDTVTRALTDITRTERAVSQASVRARSRQYARWGRLVGVVAGVALAAQMRRPETSGGEGELFMFLDDFLSGESWFLAYGATAIATGVLGGWGGYAVGTATAPRWTDVPMPGRTSNTSPAGMRLTVTRSF